VNPKLRTILPNLVGIVVLLVLALFVLHVADLSWFQSHHSDTFDAVKQHLELTLTTLAIALVIAVPLGTVVARVPFLYTPVIGILGIIYTIPSLALLALLVTYVGIGFWNAVVALVAYAQFILVRNVVVGLRTVDPSVTEAARGMGMGQWQILFKIEYPLALPTILGGLRVATVATIAISSIASLIDAGGLGVLLFDGINNSLFNTSELQVGAIAVSLLAILADLLLRIVEWTLPASRARAGSRT
jgi:osmoprotectant transport system permease protein